ncbi:hypothetical protein MX630_04925 [Carnobacterium divergens]|uniref:hypothetical protein n=1 Tax=Carnobacterium divergens TaxID=2748 RepID=UPI0028921611|nr:hypothetical protein [Carnobacterium divergens]MDT1950085.1 hypothetical protein [Carnobacterium divergens]MDT1955263.1 hypothetical protein [Carnobacterium divergens]MDT1960501.1 hypothetical protein [Carnobacterium divergens]MDT1963045.1 hypothetical protein [Carnobacterium divergens]
MNKEQKIQNEKLSIITKKLAFISELKLYFSETDVLSIDEILEEEKLYLNELTKFMENKY